MSCYIERLMLTFAITPRQIQYLYLSAVWDLELTAMAIPYKQINLIDLNKQ